MAPGVVDGRMEKEIGRLADGFEVGTGRVKEGQADIIFQVVGEKAEFLPGETAVGCMSDQPGMKDNLADGFNAVVEIDIFCGR